MTTYPHLARHLQTDTITLLGHDLAADLIGRSASASSRSG